MKPYGLLFLGTVILLSNKPAIAGECEQLWVARNSIFNDNGYCFSTRLGKALFDNSDCYTKRAKLSRSERQRVARLKRRERNLGCHVNTRLSYLPGGSNNTYTSSRPSSAYTAPTPAPLGNYKCKFKCIGQSGTSRKFEVGVSVKVRAKNSSAARELIDPYKLCRKAGYDRTPYPGSGLNCSPTY